MDPENQFLNGLTLGAKEVEMDDRGRLTLKSGLLNMEVDMRMEDRNEELIVALI